MKAVSLTAHRTRYLILAGLLVVALFLVWLVGFSSALGVRTITVAGDHRVTTAQILNAADVRHGAPLSRLDTAAIRDRVAAIPAVRKVTVTTSYPSTVHITVIERTAVGYRPDSAGARLVDAANVEFDTVVKPPVGLPELQLSGDPTLAADTAVVAGTLSAQFRTVVAKIAAPTSQTITLTLTDGRTVLWGGTDRGGEKAKLLPVLVHQPGQYFDVSDPSSVISRGA